jgi:hypothetical protein
MTDDNSHDPAEGLRELIDPVGTADDALHFVRALSRLGKSDAALLGTGVVLRGGAVSVHRGRPYGRDAGGSTR